MKAAKQILHVSKEIQSKDWIAYKANCSPLVTGSFDLVCEVAKDWAATNNMDAVVVHHTSSNSEVIWR